MLNIKYLAALREIRLGVFSNNRNNLCNNNFNHIILHPHGLQASCEQSTLKKKLSGLATLREIRSGLCSDNRNNL